MELGQTSERNHVGERTDQHYCEPWGEALSKTQQHIGALMKYDTAVSEFPPDEKRQQTGVQQLREQRGFQHTTVVGV